MSRLQYGLEDAREASRNMLESIKSSKEQLNHLPGTIGTVGPLLGLVGTVYGMIQGLHRHEHRPAQWIPTSFRKAFRTRYV